MMNNNSNIYSLKELVSISTGKLNANAMVDDGIYPFFTCDSEPYRINEYAFDGEAILISGNGSQVGHLNYYNGKFNAYQRTYVLMNFSSKVNSMYLFHFLKAYLKGHIDTNSKKGSVPYITLPMLSEFQIYLPSIEEQKNIVEKLDKLEELNNVIKDKISLYDKIIYHYKNRIFNQDSNKVELKTIGKISMCKRVMKDQTSSSGDIPFYKIGTFGGKADAFISKELFDEYSSKYSYPQKGDILISAAGTIGKTVIFDGEPAYFQDSNIVWIANDETKALNKYLYYCYQLSPWNISTGGTIARIYNENIASAKIYLPSIEEQKNIVEKLDKLEELKNLFSSELNARTKLFNYYRNKLLNFEEVSISE